MNLLLFKSIIRLFGKNKLIFSLCIVGLSVGFAVFITIILHSRFEYSFDNFQSNAKNIYRLHPVYGQKDGFINTYATSDNGYGPALKKDIPEVKDYVRMIAYQSERIVTYSPEGKQKVQNREPHVFLVDSNFFTFFEYNLKIGSAHHVLVKPNTMVISESAAKKYFGNISPIGKHLFISDQGGTFSSEITGVFYDPPTNSNLQFNFLVSIATLKKNFPELDNSWNFGISYTYLSLTPSADIPRLQKRIMDVFRARSGFVIPGNMTFEMELVAMPDIHLNNPLQWELEKKGNRAETKYLLIIALVIIIVSWLNYMNITTSLVSQRLKISRIKTILGSTKAGLIRQFIAEAFVVHLISMLIALMLIFAGREVIHSFFGQDIVRLMYSNINIVGLFIGVIAIGTLVSGFLSAAIFFIGNSDFVLNQSKQGSKIMFRQIMVVAQFATSIVLIVGTMVVFKQIKYLQSQNLGVDINQIVVIKAPPGPDAHTKGINRFRQLLTNTTGVEHVSAGSDIPGHFMDMGYQVQRTAINPPVYQVTDGGRMDHEYVETMGLKIVAGQDFAQGTNTEQRVLVNEKMVELLGFVNNEDAVGKEIVLPEIWGNQPVTILGVLQNYRQQSPSFEYKPVFFMCRENEWLRFNYFMIRYSGNSGTVLSAIDHKWKKAFPDSSFDYYFLSDQYNNQYSSSIRFGQLFGFLSLMAIIISMLGLLGLSINTAQQRVKEIGIRKVNGAQIYQVMLMLNSDFTRWISMAILIAAPVAWYFMDLWLQNHAVRTSIDWWLFALAGLLALGIALLTVSWQSWKAATRNPVDSLKYE